MEEENNDCVACCGLDHELDDAIGEAVVSAAQRGLSHDQVVRNLGHALYHILGGDENHRLVVTISAMDEGLIIETRCEQGHESLN